jgi:hypothetical protein
MFEAEIEMEKRSSFLPLVLLVCLIAGILGVVTYVAVQVKQKTPLSAQTATPVVAATLAAFGPATLDFRTGLVKPSEDIAPGNPRDRLLEKAGIVKLVPAPRGSFVISLTPAGERLLTEVPGLTKQKEPDGTLSYHVALARRELLSVTGVTMNGINGATVEYAWKWVPTRLGDVFDAGSPVVKSFNTWDRQALIDKYGVRFYNASPMTSTIAFARTDQGWKVLGE